MSPNPPARGASPPAPEDRNDLGFGSVVSRQSRERLLNRDGSFNVRREGLGFFQSLSLYHWLLELTWPRFLLVLSGAFLVVNLAFALAYYLCGPGALDGLRPALDGGRFVGDFFFSVQTFATIGYGRISPAGVAANVLVVLEAVSGVLLVALGTGISFARFARPRARILFSERAVVTPHRGGTALMFRLANARRSELTDLSARLLLARRKADGNREFLPLALERDNVLFFPLGWTVVHPIDAGSPLHGLGPDDLAACRAEFLVLLAGTDEGFSQVVHARTSYEASEVVFGARFASLYNPPDADGSISIDVGRLSALERL
ncbi:MAG: transporter [Acidobacteria bacterium]|nr:transporter [Acidobacteriota bacterium]